MSIVGFSPSPAVSAGLAAAGSFVAGCMVGSFLNVVAHRIPRGETVVYGRSHCPACGTAIRARDNIPVLGWLLVRGRCRDCGWTIPPRYPLVEAGCGGLATLLAAIEWAATSTGDGSAIGGWAGRAALALTIVAWSLLAARGHAVKTTTVAIALVAAAVAGMAFVQLAPLPVGCGGAAGSGSTAAIPRILACLAGISSGWVAGSGFLCPTASRSACMLIGAASGWQAALLAAIVAGGVRRAGGGPAAACLATVSAVAAWVPMARLWGLACPGQGGG